MAVDIYDYFYRCGRRNTTHFRYARGKLYGPLLFTVASNIVHFEHTLEVSHSTEY